VHEKRDRRERLLDLGRAAAEFPEPFRRHAIADLIHERFRQEIEAALRVELPVIPCTVEEMILTAYPTTDHYWLAWLYGLLSQETLITRLAEATAISESDLQRRIRLLRQALAACPGDIDTGTAITAARWLADHPDAEGVLPSSLLTYMAGTQRRYEACTVERTAPPQTTARATAPAAADDDEATPETRLQARYDARVTEKHVPTIEEDRAWAKQQGIRQKQVEELRENNPDPRLHTRGRRQR
jgi:hypothetical protein